MFITNTPNCSGKELGLVTGEYVSSRIFFKDFFSQIRSFFGFELKAYTEMVGDAKDRAIEAMIKDAETLGATEIVNVRFVITSLTTDSVVVLATGTAVKK